MIKTKFRFLAVMVFVYLIVLTCLLGFLFFGLLNGGKLELPAVYVLPVILFVFIWIWLFFGEIRSKAIVLSIEGDFLRVKRFFGLGKEKLYELKKLEGYKISFLPTRSSVYEYLYVFENGKKVAKISAFYHNNYAAIKTVLSQKLTSMGEEEFSYLQELKEIFE